MPVGQVVLKIIIRRLEAMTMTDTEQVQSIKGAASFAAESLFPGGSQLLKGDVKSAGIYAALGLAARAALGLPGVLLVSAASFSKAMTGHHLHECACPSQPAAPPKPEGQA
jgi:Family of unknown function (DUF6072)